MTNHLYLSRIVKYWYCPRARYWNYEYQGKGIEKVSTSLPLFSGLTLHDSLATIATFHKEGVEVPIDDIAKLAFDSMKQALMEAGDGEVGTHEFAMEQATLIEGLIRGFYKHTWPILMDTYPKIVAIEQRMEYDLGDDMKFIAKPDLIVEDKSGELVYCVAPATRLLTPQLDWVEAENLKIGDSLVGVEEFPANLKLDKNGQGRRGARQWNTGTITNIRKVKKPSYKLTFSDNTTITCSDDHQWLIPLHRGKHGRGGSFNAEWRKTSDIKVGTRFLKVLEPWNINDWEPYDRGYISAALEGEGSLSQIKKSRAMSITFSQKENVMMKKVRSIFDKYSVNYGDSHRLNNVRNLYVCSKPNILKLLGVAKPQRLLDKLNFNEVGGAFPITNLTLLKKEFIGDQDVIAIETTNHTYIAEGIISHNCEYKSTSSKKQEWVDSWNTAVQLHSSIKAVEQTLGTAPSQVQIVGLYKGYISYGKQSSPFCYGYKRSGNPPFTQDDIKYDYKAGYKRSPVWEMDGGVKAWVDAMPSEILANQFPLTAPIFIDQDQVDAFFRQTKAKEIEIDIASRLINESPEDNQGLLDKVFPQHFEKCQPAWGFPCEFRKLCFGHVEDPLNEGYKVRDTSHLSEEEQA